MRARLLIPWLLLVSPACEAPPDDQTDDVLAELQVREAPGPLETTVRWDLATAEQLTRYHAAARIRAGIPADQAIRDTIGTRPVAAAVRRALIALNEASFSGIRPLVNDQGRVGAIREVGWVVRGGAPDQIARDFLSTWEPHLRAAFDVSAQEELFVAGMQDQPDRVQVVYRGRCDGIEVQGDALILEVTKDTHWLGQGVLDDVISYLTPGACPDGADRRITASTAIAAALAGRADQSLDPMDFHAEMLVLPPGRLVWRVSGRFREEASAVDIDAGSGAEVAVHRGLHENGTIAGNFSLFNGVHPQDVTADRPLKYAIVDEGTSYLTSADASGWWNAEAADTSPLWGKMISNQLPDNSYGASGTFWMVNPANECDDTAMGNIYSLPGDGSTVLVPETDAARMFYLNGWMRQRYADYSHEIPRRHGLALGGGVSYLCGWPTHWAAASVPSSAGARGNLTILHENTHAFQYCANNPGWGCDQVPSSDDSYQSRVLSSFKEGHADWVPVVMTGHRMGYDITWDSSRVFGSATDSSDWFLHPDEVEYGPCNTDADCAAGEICPIQYDPNGPGDDVAGPDHCVKVCAGAADTTTCPPLHGPTGICRSWTDDLAVPPGSGPVAWGCYFNGYTNGALYGNAFTFLGLWLGPLPGFEAVADGMELGWNKWTDMAGPVADNNFYAKIANTNWVRRYEVWRAFNPVYPLQTPSSGIQDDYPSHGDTAPVMESLGRTSNLVGWGSANGDTTADIDIGGDLDFFHIKAVKGETYTITLTPTGGSTLDGCLALYGANRAFDLGGSPLLIRDTTCTTTPPGTSQITYPIPVTTPHDWLVIRVEGNARTTGSYTLSITSADEAADNHPTAPTWQDAFPLAVGIYQPAAMGTVTDSDWFKFYVPDTTANQIEVSYSSNVYLPVTSIWTSPITGSGPPPAPACGPTTGMFVTCPLATVPGWYYIRAASPGYTGSYQIRVRLLSSGTPIPYTSVDIPATAGTGAPIAFTWGDMAAERLYALDTDSYEVTLAEGDRLTVTTAFDSGICQSTVKVRAGVNLDVPPGGTGTSRFSTDPAQIMIFDQTYNGLDFGPSGRGSYLSFVAPYAGNYSVYIQGDSTCWGQNYRAYFTRAHDIATWQHIPAFDTVAP